MKIVLPILCLAVWAFCSTGCSDFEAPEAVSQAAPSEAAPLAAAPLEGAAPEGVQTFVKDVLQYERSMGTGHGLGREEISDYMTKLMQAPVFKNRFLGISTLQQPSDAWILMEILYEVKPDLVIEAGTGHGGSAVLWAIILEHISPDGRVITIDIEDQREAGAKEIPIAKRKVDFLLGSSADPEIVAEVHRRAEGKRVVVLLDSLHSKDHVAAELEAYAPLVPVGSYIVVQDTVPGPLEAINEFLAKNDSFVADRARERYSDTSAIRGYLRRVKI